MVTLLAAVTSRPGRAAWPCCRSVPNRTSTSPISAAPGRLVLPRGPGLAVVGADSSTSYDDLHVMVDRFAGSARRPACGDRFGGRGRPARAEPNSSPPSGRSGNSALPSCCSIRCGPTGGARSCSTERRSRSFSDRTSSVTLTVNLTFSSAAATWSRPRARPGDPRSSPSPGGRSMSRSPRWPRPTNSPSGTGCCSSPPSASTWPSRRSCPLSRSARPSTSGRPMRLRPLPSSTSSAVPVASPCSTCRRATGTNGSATSVSRAEECRPACGW